MLKLTCWAFWYKPVNFGVKTESGITKLAKFNQTVIELGLRGGGLWIVVRVGVHQISQVYSPPPFPKVDSYGEAVLPIMSPQVSSPGFGTNLATFGRKTIRRPESGRARNQE